MAAHEHDAGLEVLESFFAQAERDPREPGEEHPDVPGLWVAQPPSLARLPRLVIVYTIDDDAGFVDMRNLYRL